MFNQSELADIAEREKVWEDTLVKEGSRRYPDRQEVFATESGIPLKRIYGPQDIAELDYARDLGFPGAYPYTRGIYPTMYRGRTWSHRQIIGFGTPKEANARVRKFLGQGLTAISLAPDVNISLGYDPDDPLVRDITGAIGFIGPSILEWEEYLEGIPLDQISAAINETSAGIISLSMYLAIAEKRGIPFSKLSGSLQLDFLATFHSMHYPCSPVEPSMRFVGDIFKFCCDNVPRWNPVQVSGYNIREGGSNAVQELAFGLADGICYLETGIKAGCDVDVLAPRISYLFASGNDFFEEIAKLRAARRMWARIVKERFGAKNPESMRMKFHTQTAGSTLTVQQPHNNIVRSAFQGLAAVLGGTQSLHVNSMDEAYASPTEQAALLSIRTQLIMENETGVANVIDPLGGSYFVEALTDEMERRAQEYLDRIDAMGGVLECIKTDFFLKEIAAATAEYHSSIDRGERVIVGVNRYQTDETSSIETYKPDPAIQEEAVRRIQALRETRDAAKHRQALESLRGACRSGDNLVPHVMEACKSYATFAEIMRLFFEEFGRYTYPAVF